MSGISGYFSGGLPSTNRGSREHAVDPAALWLLDQIVWQHHGPMRRPEFPTIGPGTKGSNTLAEVIASDCEDPLRWGISRIPDHSSKQGVADEIGWFAVGDPVLTADRQPPLSASAHARVGDAVVRCLSSPPSNCVIAAAAGIPTAGASVPPLPCTYFVPPKPSCRLARERSFFAIFIPDDLNRCAQQGELGQFTYSSLQSAVFPKTGKDKKKRCVECNRAVQQQQRNRV